MVQIGKYTLEPCEHGGVWISIEGGEGMQVVWPESLRALEALLDQFWKEHF